MTRLESSGFKFDYGASNGDYFIDAEWEAVARKEPDTSTLVDLGIRADRHAIQVRAWRSDTHTYLNFNTGDDPYRVDGRLTDDEVRKFARSLWMIWEDCEGVPFEATKIGTIAATREGKPVTVEIYHHTTPEGEHVTYAMYLEDEGACLIANGHFSVEEVQQLEHDAQKGMRELQNTLD